MEIPMDCCMNLNMIYQYKINDNHHSDKPHPYFVSFHTTKNEFLFSISDAGFSFYYDRLNRICIEGVDEF
jgi:hypothetical protein